MKQPLLQHLTVLVSSAGRDAIEQIAVLFSSHVGVILGPPLMCDICCVLKWIRQCSCVVFLTVPDRSTICDCSPRIAPSKVDSCII